MGGNPHADRSRDGARDPVLISRADLTDDLADLDEAYDALDRGAHAQARRLLDGVLCRYHARVFAHLPDGEGPQVAG
ncbi:MAG TPA: hypothetical protein PKA98_09525 [Acidimicrobiales bacterium]|nr:hypothetical protein [Acidimicrobiales bacterium]